METEFHTTLSTGLSVWVVAIGILHQGELHVGSFFGGRYCEEPSWVELKQVDVFDDVGGKPLLTPEESMEVETRAMNALGLND